MDTITINDVNFVAKFSKAQAEISLASEKCRNIVIHDDESAKEAREFATISNKVLKKVDEIRKELVAPHVEAQKLINAHAREISDQLDTALMHLKQKIQHFEAERRKEAARLAAIKQSLAELRVKAVNAIQFADDPVVIDQIMERFDSKYKPDDFKPYQDDFTALRTQMQIEAEARCQALEEAAKKAGEAKSKEDAERIERELAAKAEAERQAAAKQAELTQRSMEKQQATLQKGVRRDWTYEVEDFDRLPSSFKMIDHAAIKDWMKENRDKLTDKEGGDDSIPGIRFFQKETVVLR